VTIFPVIARELRVSARHAFTYYLRALGAGALVLASLLFIAQHGSGPTLGGRLFASLHFTLFFAIWVLVPLLTADCLSRERREGTLGLLFLTRLKATDIVVAKSAAHGLRALSLWLAVLPVVTIPFLLGGLSWVEALFSALINFSAICWALAAGLLASAWSKTFLRSLLLSTVLAIGAVFALAFGVGRLLWSVAYATSITYVGAFRWQAGSDSALADGLGFVTDAMGNWSFYTRWAARPLLWAVAQSTMFSVFVLFLAILIAGAKTRRVWQEGPPSQAQVWWEQVFCTPFLWLSFFRRWMRHKLERNPVGWLQQRTWTGRLVTWGWFAVTISLYSAVLTDPNFLRTSSFMQRTMSWLLAGSMALSAAGSFRRERETGVLELLLVSPLGERDIIAGRLRGLWGQFLPAVGLLLGIWSYFSSLLRFTGLWSDTEAIIFSAVTFLTLPVIGLYFSLRCRGFLAALISTLAVGLLLPMICPVALEWLWARYTKALLSGQWEIRPSGEAAFFQLVLAAWCWSRLYHRLRDRAFPLERAVA